MLKIKIMVWLIFSKEITCQCNEDHHDNDDDDDKEDNYDNDAGDDQSGKEITCQCNPRELVPLQE